MNRLLDWLFVPPGGSAFSLRDALLQKQGRETYTSSSSSTPVRDELVLEIISAAKRLDVDHQRMRIVVSDQLRVPASAGSSLFPGDGLYLLVPSTWAMNYMLSSWHVQSTSEMLNTDINPNTDLLIMNPGQRFALAHELSHLAQEHHMKRIGAQSLALAVAFAAGPIARRAFQLPWRKAAVVSTWGLAPAFFFSTYISRLQETQADLGAAQAGYVHGGIAFWQQQASLEAARGTTSATPTPWRTHPPAVDRLRTLQAFAAQSFASESS